MKSYLPGTWYAVLGEQVTLLLPPGEKHRVGELWAMVDAGVGFDGVLDQLLAGGLSTLSGFGLVGEDGGNARVLMRGNVRATFIAPDGPHRVDGTGVATWAELSLVGVSGFVVELDSEVFGSDDLPIGSGLVRVARLTAPGFAAAAERGRGSIDAMADTGTVEPVLPVPPLGDTGPRTGPGADGTADHDGRTSMKDPDAFGPVAPGIPGQPQAPAVTARPVARLLLSTGDSVDVDRAVLFGRAPEARRFQVGEEPRLITVLSPHQEISSTHLEIRPGSGVDHGTAVVTDLGSTNGTVIVQPGLGPEELQAGIAVQLIPGAIVDLGDGVTIQVINP